MSCYFQQSQMQEAPDPARALIETEWEDLLYYDGPVLFTGLNEAGERVLGSLVEYDSEGKVEWYIHCLPSSEHWQEYTQKRMSYNAVMRASECFMVAWNNAEKPPFVSPIRLEDMPEYYRPSEDAYYPCEE